MALLRITNGFEKMGDPELLDRSNDIHQHVSSQSSVFTTPSPTMPVLRDAIDEFQSAMLAASNGNRLLVTQKNRNRETVIDLLHKLGYYVLFIAQGDPLVAEKAAYTVAKSSSPIVLTQPAAPVVVISTQPGEVLLSTRRVKGARSYVFQYTDDPTLAESSWMSHNCTTAKCKLTGLTRGKEYAFRVGAIGANGQVLYSDVVKKFVS